MENTNYLVKAIEQALKELEGQGSSDENPRVKALVRTKLQEAEHWAEHLFDKE